MSGVSAAWINRAITDRLAAVNVSPRALGAVVVAAALFKLAISDGGRHPAALALAQAGLFAVFAVLILSGSSTRSTLTRPMVSLLAAVAVTAIGSVRVEASLRELLLWLFYLAVGTATASTLVAPASVRRFLDTLVVIAGWLVLIAAFMAWGSNQPGMRWYATFYWPNPFAGFLLLVLPLTLVRCAAAADGRSALAQGLMSVLLGVAFVLTSSRGAWIAFAATVPLAIRLLRRSGVAAAGRVALVALTVALVVLGITHGPPAPGTAGLGARAASIADPGDPSIVGRLHFWQAALAIFRDHPWGGTGPGTFAIVHPRYQRDVRYYASNVHSLYLQTLAEMGAVGAAALAWVVVSIMMLAVRAIRNARDPDEYALVGGIALGLAAFALHSAVELDWFFPAAPATAFALVGVLVWFDHQRHSPPRRIAPAGWRYGAAVVLALAVAAVAILHVAAAAFARGQEAMRSGGGSTAAAAYARAIRWNPLSPRYRAAYAAAVVRLPQPRFDLAEAQLRRAMALDPMNASHPLELAALLLGRSGSTLRLPEVRTLVESALTLDARNRPEAYRLLAHVHLLQGDRAAADRTYQRAGAVYAGRYIAGGIQYVLLWPEVAALYQDWAAFLTAGGRTGEAVDVLNILLRDDPARVAAYVQLAGIHLRRGELALADRVLRAGLERNPASEILWVHWRTLPQHRSSPWER